MAPAPRYQVYGLHETYPELGRFAFKIVLNPRFFKSGQDFEISFVDSDRRPMAFDLKRWGRKLNVDFIINPGTADGVAVITILRGTIEVGRLKMWVIKP